MSKGATNDDRLTIKEAARLLGVHPNTVRKRIKDGTYEAEKIYTERGPIWTLERSNLPANLNNEAALPHPQKSVSKLSEEDVRLLLATLSELVGSSREVEVSPANRAGATLNHIDKLHETLSRAVLSRNRAYLLMQILSVLILTVSIGVVSTQEAFSFSLAGLQLDISLPVFLVGAGIILAVFAIRWYSLSQHIIACNREIRGRYKSIGYDIGAASTDGWTTAGEQYLHPLDVLIALRRPPSAPRLTKLERVYVSVVIACALYGFVLLPVLAEIAAALKLADAVGWQQYWIWVPALLLVFFTLRPIIPWNPGSEWYKHEVMRAYHDSTPEQQIAFDYLADHPDQDVTSRELASVVYPDDSADYAENRLYALFDAFGTRAQSTYGKDQWFFYSERERHSDGSLGNMVYIMSAKEAAWLQEAGRQPDPE